MEKVKKAFLPHYQGRKGSSEVDASRASTDVPSSDPDTIAKDFGQQPVTDHGHGGGIADTSGNVPQYGASPGVGISSFTADQSRPSTDISAASPDTSNLTSKEAPNIPSAVEHTRAQQAAAADTSNLHTSADTTSASTTGIASSTAGATAATGAAAAGTSLPGSFPSDGIDSSKDVQSTSAAGADLSSSSGINDGRTRSVGEPGNSAVIGPSFTDRKFTLGSGGQSTSASDSSHPTFTGSRLDPHVSGSSSSGAVGGAAAGGAAGAAALAATEGHGSTGTKVESSKIIPGPYTQYNKPFSKNGSGRNSGQYSTDGAVAGAGTGAAGIAAATAWNNHSQSDPQKESSTGASQGDSHLGRDAAIGGGALAASAAAGAKLYNEKGHLHGTPDTPAAATSSAASGGALSESAALGSKLYDDKGHLRGSSGSGSKAAVTSAGESAVGGGALADSSAIGSKLYDDKGHLLGSSSAATGASASKAEESDHHYGRDAAIGGGVLAAGAAVGAKMHEDREHAASSSAAKGVGIASTTDDSHLSPDDEAFEKARRSSAHHIEKEHEYNEQTKHGGVLGFLHKSQKPKYQDPEEPDTTAREKYYGGEPPAQEIPLENQSHPGILGMDRGHDHHGAEAGAAAGIGAAAGAGVAGASTDHAHRQLSPEEEFEEQRKHIAHHEEQERKYNQQSGGGLLGALHKDQHPKYQDDQEPDTTARQKYYGTEDYGSKGAEVAGGAGAAGAAGAAAVGAGVIGSEGDQSVDRKDSKSEKRGSISRFFHRSNPNKLHKDPKGATDDDAAAADPSTSSSSAPRVEYHHG